MADEPLVGHRLVKVTEQKTKKDWAYFGELAEYGVNRAECSYPTVFEQENCLSLKGKNRGRCVAESQE